MTENEGESKRFAPKVAVQLDPPKDDLISQEELAKCDGTYFTPHSTQSQKANNKQAPIRAVRLWSLSKVSFST
jgi:hypothetical protein